MRPGKLAALGVGLVTLLTYLWTAGPTFYWLDSSELVAAAWGLGVAHPPGHPLASLLARLCCLLPVGTISFRVTLACALQAAAAAALLTLLTRRLLAQLALLGEKQRSACAALAGLSLGFSYALWFQAVRAEVYALNLLLLVAVVHELVAWEQESDRRRLLAAALLFGLALCNHHFLALLLVPALLLFVLLRRPAPGLRRLAALVVVAGLLGLCTLAYLPLRSRRLPEVDWGAPRTASRFYWTVSARAFQQAVDRASRQSLEQRAGGAGFALLGGLGPIAAAIAAGGVYLLWRRRETRRAALLLTAGIGGNLVSPLLVGFDPFNPDTQGYLAVSVALLAPGLAVLIGAAGQLLARWRGPAPSATLLAVCAILPLQQAWTGWRACDLRHHWAAEETGRAQLAVAPGALLVTSFFETLFDAWALRVTADLRPDLGLLHRHFVDQPGYLEDLLRRDPSLSDAAQAWGSPGGPRGDALDRLAARPLLVEPDLDLPPAVESKLGPDGLLLRWRGSRTAAAQREHLERVAAWRAAVGPVEENETRRSVTWAHFVLGRFACREGLPALGHQHLGWARELASEDQRLAEVIRRCTPR
jgi:hypothetical protein